MKPASRPPPPFFLPLLLLLLSATTSTATGTILSPSPSPTSSPSSASSATLDPKQLRALHSLNIPTAQDPCLHPLHNATVCDSSAPFRHLLLLRLSNCSADLSLSFAALKYLSSLHTLQLLSCPHLSAVRLPSSLAVSLRSFTAIRSLRKLTGVWLSRLRNLTDLTVSEVPVNASGPVVILGNMKELTSVTISHSNLTGNLPKHWHSNLTYIDFSGNKLRGKIPSSITLLENLEFLNLSSNLLNGEIPSSFGDLISLKNLSLASNSLSGSLPDSMSAMPDLVHLDLSSNQINGTIPKFISNMKSLTYLNLENNQFHGVLPFSGTFIKKLYVLKIGGNSNLCYNHSLLSSKLKLGIAPCDKHGLPLSPPPAKADSSGDDTGEESSDDSDYNVKDENDSGHKDDHHHGPSKIVLGVAIGLSSMVFLIIFMVLLSKWCR